MNSLQESMSRKNKEARRRVIYQGTEFMVPSVQSRCPSRRDKSARTNILSDTRGCLRSVNQHWSGERKQHPGWLRKRGRQACVGHRRSDVGSESLITQRRLNGGQNCAIRGNRSVGTAIHLNGTESRILGAI